MALLRRTLFLFVFLAAAARAQSVHWESGDSDLGSVVQLVFQDCEPADQPTLPPIANAQLAYAGTSTAMNMVNFSVSRTVTLSYVVQGLHGGPLQIPAFTVKTNKGPMKVAAFNAGAPAVSPESVASAKLLPEKTTVWAGEVFNLDYELTAARRNNPQINPTFDWNAAPFVAEDWSKYQVSEAVVDGQRQVKITYHTRVYAPQANTLKLAAANHMIQVQTGTSSFGLFSQPRMEPVSVTSDQPTIEVKALPPAPPAFNGAVGHFKLVSKVVPKQAAVGEPITWTLELSGTGNWPQIPGLPARDVSRDFQVIQPKPKRDNADGKLFDATLTEDAVLIPTKPGTYTLGPVTYSFFNPDTGAYETLRTDATTVTVNPAPTAASSGAPAPTAGGTPPASEATPRAAPAVPAPPAAIPRDPLPGEADAARPLTTGALVAWLLAPLAGLVALWLVLAVRRAAATDPLRPKREAHTRLKDLLASMRTDAGDEPARSEKLLAWQHDAAVLWGLPQAAPGADALAHAIRTQGRPAAAADEWSTLWREADRTLYGAATPLPGNWVPRAEVALGETRLPGFNPARLFLPRNLLAFAAAVALFITMGTPRLRAAAPTPDAAYRAGDFKAAEKSWREAVSQQPTDWIARHNLALALAQQDRAGEAAAQAVAAFVQHPGNPSVRWHFSTLTEKAGFAPAPLTDFLREGPALAVAALASPATWQRILIAAAFAVAAALGWLLCNGYGRRSRAQAWSAMAACAVAALVGIVAIFGIVAYGDTAERNAVIVWQQGLLRSIPTEVDTPQKTSTLSPGSVGVVDKSFLGWDRLVFSNGQTGWVRHEDVVPLW